MHTPPNLPELFHRYVNNQCTPEEAELVLQWLETAQPADEHQKAINNILHSRPPEDYLSNSLLTAALQRNMEAILQRIEEPKVIAATPRFKWWKLPAAAALFVLAGTLAYVFFYNNRRQRINPIVKHETPVVKDIKPGSNKAILTLSNGKQLVLDDANNGDLAQQGNTKIIKIDGRLAYHKENGATEVVYNTITTPKGGQYQLVLADGSLVWLNAASSLRFPTAFPGKERSVELTGEGYFEIAKNAAQPFHVKVNNMEVEVLGTHFNIMAYGDESMIKTTLLEGSVKLKNGAQSAFLKPGQQARLKDENVKIVDDVDIEGVMAWKNGFFQFDRNTSIQQVMRQIARWYDVDINYDGAVPRRSFGGKISRESNLSEVLKVLEVSKVHFKLEGKKLSVMP